MAGGWNLWRVCIVCEAKLCVTVDLLEFGYLEQGYTGQKELGFYATCSICHAVNILDESIIPEVIQEIAKKKFHSQRKSKRRGTYAKLIDLEK